MTDLTDLNEEICSICLEALVTDDPDKRKGGIVNTGCNHYFHRDCLLGWLEETDRGNWCPLCKHPFCSDELGVEIRTAFGMPPKKSDPTPGPSSGAGAHPAYLRIRSRMQAVSYSFQTRGGASGSGPAPPGFPGGYVRDEADIQIGREIVRQMELMGMEEVRGSGSGAQGERGSGSRLLTRNRTRRNSSERGGGPPRPPSSQGSSGGRDQDLQ